MRLALACGIWDVDLMLRRLTPRQFDEWYALEQIEGISVSAHRDDLRARHMTAAQLQIQGWDGTADDLEFLPHLRRERDSAGGDTIEDNASAVRAAFGG